jgi:two-component system chemotaxis sensor kinase CheA
MAQPRDGAGADARGMRHVRVALSRLDTLTNLVGELVVARGRLGAIAARLADPALDDALGETARLVAELQDGIMRSRMVPVWQVFERFPRLVRDTARTLGKEVELEVGGQDIELDRSMLDELGEPVVHLLRNAVDHGIEPPDERAAAGKPRAGRVTLSASRERSAVIVRVRDDGRGIDREKVLARARASGLVDAARRDVGDDEIAGLLARPGFTTAERVTSVSGRGVGIDAVQARVRALGGAMDIRSTPREGTCVTLRLPATLAIVHAVLVRVGEETYVLPVAHVTETLRATRELVRDAGARPVIVLRDEVLPLVSLREVVGLPACDLEGRRIVVLEVGERRGALLVDALLGQQDVVVKSVDAVRGAAACFGGATILGDGRPALILDVGTLF